MEQFQKKYPEFMKIVDLVSKQNPLQRKRIHKFIIQQNLAYWEYAEKICQTLLQSFLNSEQAQIEAAASYNRMSMDFLKEQIRFSKTGVYSVDDATIANENVYKQPEVMRYYMVGLLISYLLWPNHYKMLNFFKTYIKQMSKIDRYLEIAPGHGLFTVEILQQFPDQKATLVDISKTSIQVTTAVLAAFKVDPSGFQFVNSDFMTASLENNSYDFISMGEVLEHVNDAAGFLERASDLLRPGGILFMTTCANCPAIDHVYHFHNEDEIRSMINDVGLSIIKEEILPVDTVQHDGCYNELISLNYCAILTS